MSPVETISKVKNSSILEIQQFFVGENDSKIWSRLMSTIINLHYGE